MNEILAVLGWGAMALLGVAVLVAGCEHMVQQASGKRMVFGAHAEGEQRAHSVDVSLDTLDLPVGSGAWVAPAARAAVADPSTDRDARVAVMAQVLSRAADPARASPEGGRWQDTTPRVVGLSEPVLSARSGAPNPRPLPGADSAQREERQAERHGERHGIERGRQ